MTTPLLQMPDFDKHFIFDYDAFGTGFGTILYQGDDTIPYFSWPVAPHHQNKLLSYEHELM
jgi:hypothetical protein